jgi:hypothetical protein
MTESLLRSESLLFATFSSLIILLTVVFYRRKLKDASWLFLLTHGTALTFFFCQQSTLLHAPSLLFSLTMLISLIAFPLGYYITSATPKTISQQKCDHSSTIMLALNRIGYLFYFAAYIYELSIAGWILPIFAEDKLLAYYTFPQQFVHYFVVLSIPISLLYSYLYWTQSKGSALDHLTILSMILLNSSILARAVVMTQLFVTIYFWFVSRKIKLNTGQIVAFTFSILLFITTIGYFRTGGSFRILLDIGGLSHWPEWTVPLAWIYIYFSTSIENFRFIYHHYELTSISGGLRTFIIYIFTLFQIKDLIPYQGGFEISSGGFNTCGIYLAAYLDFDLMFPIYFLLLGMITCILKHSNKLIIKLLWPYWLYCIFTSAVNDYVSSFFTLIYMLYLLAITTLSNTRIRCRY